MNALCRALGLVGIPIVFYFVLFYFLFYSFLCRGSICLVRLFSLSLGQGSFLASWLISWAASLALEARAAFQSRARTLFPNDGDR